MATRTIHGLGLCSGIGGLELAMRLIYGDTYRCVAHVEREAYAAAVLVARMEEQTLDQAPIWDDLTTFPSEQFSGRVDLICAGFPCQPFSAAGNRQGKADDRWLWPLIFKHIEIIRPSIIFIENVPGIRHHGLPDILSDLASLGFDAEWMHLTAGDLGATHKRRRFFLLAHASSMGRCSWPGYGETEEEGFGWSRSSDQSINLARGFPPGPEDVEGWSTYAGPQPGIQRSPNGSAASVERGDRVRVCGNSVVPVVVAAAYITLAKRFEVNTNDQEQK